MMNASKRMLMPLRGHRWLHFALILLALAASFGAPRASAQVPGDTLYVSVDPLVAGGAPGNDVTGTGSEAAPYRQITKAVSVVKSRNKHVIFVAPSRGSLYSGSIGTPFDWPLKIVSQKGPDSTRLSSTSGYEVVSLYADTTLQVLEGFTITANIVGGCEGVCVGGVYAYGRAWVLNNKIYGNMGEGGGGGINYYGVLGYGGIIAGNWIANNSEAFEVSGGGIQVDYAYSLHIINNTIIGNTSPTGAGIKIGSDALAVTVANNIIAYNLAGYGIYTNTASVTVANNLFYLNEAGDFFGLAGLDATNITGPGADPFLAGLGILDFHQTCESPGRDLGSDSFLPPELVSSGHFDWDIDGPPQARSAYSAIDIGGDEFWDTRKIASFVATPREACDSLVVSFTNTSVCVDEQWIWNFGDGDTSSQKNPVHAYKVPGSYTVTLTAMGELDSDTFTRPNYIKVAAPLTVDFSADTTVGIDTLTVTFTAQPSLVPDSLRWFFGDGGSAKGNPVVHTYTHPGIFNVDLRGYNSCGTVSKSKSAMIIIGSKSAPPAETLFVSVDPLMQGGLPGNDSTGDGSRFAPFREIRQATSQMYQRNSHVIFVGPSRGGYYSGPVSTLYNYRIKIISEKGADSTYLTNSTGFETVDLYADTVLQVFQGFTVADNVVGFCEGSCVGGIYAYGRAWIINNKIFRNVGSGGGGGINYWGVPGHTGIIAGNWIAQNRDAGGVLGGGIQVDNSTSLFIINNTIISNTSQTGAGINLGTAAVGVTIANNIIAYNQTGYGIYKVATAPTVVANNLFHSNPANTFGLPPLDGTNLLTNPFLFDYTKLNFHQTCGSPGRNHGSNTLVPTELTNSGDFAWDQDWNPTGSRQGRIFQTVIDIGGDEFWDAAKRALFDATPKIGCNTLQVSFANNSSCIDEQWIWSFGDGGTSNSKNPVHTYTAPGSYTVRLIAKGDLDSDTLTIPDFIKVAAPLEISFTADPLTACDSLTATFTAVTNVSADSLRWIFGDGGTALGNPVTHKFNKVGVFDVELQGYNPCGMVSSVRPAYVTVGTKPEIIVTASSDSSGAPKCIPYPVRLHAVSGQPLNSWLWDFGDSDTTGSRLSDPVHTYTRTGSFSVRLIATGNCGIDTATRQQYLVILSRPTATMDANPKAVCASGQPVSFTATYQGTVDSSRWLFGDGGTAPGPNTTHLYPGSGVYQPRLILFHPCATDTLTLNSTVGVGTLPVAALYGSPRTGYEPLATQFADSSKNDPTAWQWVFGDGSSSTEKNPLHLYQPGIWDVSLTSSNVCGTSETAMPQYIRVGGFRPSFDSTGSNGDSILFEVLVDSLVMRYDRAITLVGGLPSVPRRGSASFVFGVATGTPRFATTMTMIPTGDLASGDYTVRLSAIDPRITKTAERTVHYSGHKFIDITPDSLQFGRQVFGGPYSKQVYIHNRAPAGSGFRLTFTASDSGQGYFARVNGTVNPQESTLVQVSFSPSRKGDYIGALVVTSDDPVSTRERITLRGRGTPDLILPRVAATVPQQPLGEVRIDSMVRFVISEPVIATRIDSLLIVSAKRSPAPVIGHLVFSSGLPTRPWTWVGFVPESCVWFPPDDTLRFRLRAILADTAENGLDGDLNGIDSGSPVDDYLFSVITGPGIRPGDADDDFRVDERDILPLARYWGLQGPPRLNVCDGFVVQPGSAWNPREATHADADGNGVVDSADVCPIAQYFDREAAAPKPAVESWMNQARTWDKSLIRSLLNGLVNCAVPGQGQAVLHRFLNDLQTETPIPDEYSLGQNYPNPFNPTTVIEYSLKSPTHVRLEIFDITGRLVTVLETGEQSAGHHTRIWDGTDAENRPVASGIYFYRLVTPEFRMARKMVLMK